MRKPHYSVAIPGSETVHLARRVELTFEAKTLCGKHTNRMRKYDMQVVTTCSACASAAAFASVRK